ncbi:hypothetical protein [Actinoplanes sp. GCM10030250]|uniref:hypothetical protein n=1 Tax=Actinoplanes sp. GCM10030250 TaxID=3273376 RepID=UPI00360DD56A
MPISDEKEKSDSLLTAVEVLATCSNGTCPTIYASNRGTVLVQGYTVSADAAVGVGVTPPVGEQVVEIPAELLAQAFAAMKGQ